MNLLRGHGTHYHTALKSNVEEACEAQALLQSHPQHMSPQVLPKDPAPLKSRSEASPNHVDLPEVIVDNVLYNSLTSRMVSLED